jgi:hypothetical protein
MTNLGESANDATNDFFNFGECELNTRRSYLITNKNILEHSIDGILHHTISTDILIKNNHIDIYSKIFFDLHIIST